MKPKITVLMSVFNGISYLREAVESILGQTYSEFEFIIIDDASTDDTWSLLSEFAAKDERIVLYRNEQNLGLTRSLNKGIKLARGEYIARQDADDVSLPMRFQKQIEAFEACPNTALISSNIDMIDSKGQFKHQLRRACPSFLVAWNLIFSNYIAGHSQVMFKRELALSVGGYPELYRYSQDYALWCRLSELGEITILPEVLLQQRQHDKSISSEKKQDQKLLALTQSKYNISKLIGEGLTLDEVADLRGVAMMPDVWEDFSNGLRLSGERASAVNEKFQKIFQAFLKQLEVRKAINEGCYSGVVRELQNFIANKFALWMQLLSLKENPLLKIKISMYIFYWSPSIFIACWLEEFQRVSKVIFLLLSQNIRKRIP